MKLPYLIALLAAFAHLACAAPLTVTLKAEGKVGTKIIALVDASGDVGVESDISQSSFQAKGKGIREVDLGNGKIAELGIYRVRVFTGAESVSLLIPVLSAQESVPVPKPAPLSASERSALEKYFANLKAAPKK